MDDHADHALPESASRFARLHDGAFSERLFNNLRILGDIYQFEIISIRLNHHDSSPSTTDQRRYDEVYQTSRLRSSNPYRNCQRRLAPSRHLRQDDPDCSSVSHLQNLSLSALLGCQTSLVRPLERSPTP